MSTFFRFVSGIILLAGITACSILLAMEDPSWIAFPLLIAGVLFGSGVWAVFFWAFADVVEQGRRLTTLLAPPSLASGFSDRDPSEEEAPPLLEARWTLRERTEQPVE